ncbi:MAG: hypothetical protein DWB42_10255 [Chloroflexi bacterium]|nr:hypothetical protein [Chloroflexota bacterium]MDL1884286.1 hypothetical protein [Anaerolineae bacterium CFX8]
MGQIIPQALTLCGQGFLVLLIRVKRRAQYQETISHYGQSYKREAVAKAETSGSVSQTARELGISNESLHTWIKQYGQPLFSRQSTGWAMGEHHDIIRLYRVVLQPSAVVFRH